MASESLEIKVHAKPDFKEVDQGFDRIAKKFKKGFSLFGSGAGGSEDQNSKNKKSKKKRKLEAASKYAGGSAYASKIGADGSDLDETGHGGFYNTLDKKISAAKDLFSKKKKKKEEDEEEKTSSTKPDSFKQLQIQKSEIKIQHAHFDKGGFGGLGGSGGNTNPSEAGESGGGLKSKFLSALGATIPIAGAAFAVAGGVLKTISAIGEQYHASMQSQASTIGATGGYVGGGGGYFSNSELAQANVFKSRVSGESIYQKGNLIDSNTIQFAASQGKGIADVVKELETIRKDSKNADLGYLRGGAAASGFTGLRQSEYISKLASISENLRNKGFSGDISDFAKFSSGFNRNDSKMDPSRRMALAEDLSNQGRSGAFGGGIFGSLSMSHALGANGGDIFKAIEESELSPGKYMSSALSSLDPKTRGLVHKLQGGSFSEMSNMSFGYKNFSSDNSRISAGYNKGLELDNRKKETFASDVGAQAAEVGYNLNTAMIQVFKENKNAMLGLTEVVSNIETKLLPVVSTSITGIVTGVEKLCEYSEPVFGAISKLMSFSNPAGFLVRTK
ncbi:hypothetical protein [Leptospira alstonii]|uniref:Uncharacterized protein n=1 Tax=Leptospira alstonii serovar Sichuan str. 79601 TaxID=1218565 RepID=M6D9V5_9LEPT|nr:hypothetical protein [Leptospira alstonii]AGS80485.1 hypothetical protein LEP1GSC193_0750 [Leptospira phage vB_LalZ_80412-LE1]EMJ95340.1 hypothetical protein LEP1GSC194_3550 [Leptospira alstonii serovar Sichuan str. 79601]